MAFINTVVTDVPPFRYSTTDIREAAARWLSASPDQLALFDRLTSSTQISRRHFAIPIEDVLRLNSCSQRAEVFDRVGTSLLTSVMEKALISSGRSVGDVQGLVFTSCSVPAIPSIDVKALQALKISPSITRLPVFQHGCAGGAIGLSLTNKIHRSPGITLLASVELCSLVYQASDLTGGNLVGSAIFGDGAACVVISEDEGPLQLVATQSHLIPNSYHLMGYNSLDDGMHLRLDREVPQCLTRTAPPVIMSFLRDHGLSPEDIRWWIFHPGGAKILSCLEDAFRLSREQCSWSWSALRENGNMSSASVLFALSSFIEEKPFKKGEKLFMLGVGPGLVLELLLFECME